MVRLYVKCAQCNTVCQLTTVKYPPLRQHELCCCQWWSEPLKAPWLSVKLTAVSSDMWLWWSSFMSSSSSHSLQCPSVLLKVVFYVFVAEMGFDRLLCFHHPSRQHVHLQSASASITSQRQKKAGNGQTFSASQGQESCSNFKQCAGGVWEVRRLFEQNLRAECQFTSKRKNTDTELHFTVPLLKSFSSFIHLLSKSRRHLGTYQQNTGAIKLTGFFFGPREV